MRLSGLCGRVEKVKSRRGREERKREKGKVGNFAPRKIRSTPRLDSDGESQRVKAVFLKRNRREGGRQAVRNRAGFSLRLIEREVTRAGQPPEPNEIEVSAIEE